MILSSLPYLSYSSFPHLLNGDDNIYLPEDYDDDMCLTNITLSMNVSFLSFSNKVGETIMLI